jgi:hypothetical protein
MWLYNAFPKDRVKAKFGFAVSKAWLDHLRLSSVHFSNGGSGAFVSGDGLLLTAHHVAADCIQELSSGANDYMKAGFSAQKREQEMKCPDLSVDVLETIEDVASRVNGALAPGASPADALQAQKAAMATIEKSCDAPPAIHCDVIPLYSGGVYNLYKYKRYADVRLVFAPEYQMAFFGGDPDNYSYPRFDLDAAFLRAYEDGKPAHVSDFLRWSKNGVKGGDLVFVSGNPGATNRWKTVAQLNFLRDVDYPAKIESQKRWIALLDRFSAASEDNEKIARQYVYGAKNGFKAFLGYENGLQNKTLMAKKIADEKKLGAAYLAKNGSSSDPWQKIDKAMAVQAEIYAPLTYIERMRGFATQYARYARTLVRVAQEKTRPNGERLREYRDSSLPGIEARLFADNQLYPSLETAVFTESLEQMQLALGSRAAETIKFLGGRSCAEYAKSAIENTKLGDPAMRKQLYQGGEAAIEASNDPMIVLMRSVEPEARAVRKRYEDEVESVERTESPRIAQAIFAQYGFAEPPDATSTLRISYGTVRGSSGSAHGTPYFMTIDGTFKRAAEHGNAAPYQVSESWIAAKPKLNLQTPLDFTSTADIIGGNSGSPIVNRAGEVVGVVFDANMDALSGNFVYSDDTARAISVDARAIHEALLSIYPNGELIKELGTSSARSNR